MVVYLSLEDAIELLEVPAIPAEPRQQARFHNWIGRLVESRGETFVLTNRRDLLNQWEEFSKANFKTCV